MRIINRLFVALFALISLSSCLNTDDPFEVFYEWKAENETFFQNKLDSIEHGNGFQEFNIPTNHGGGKLLYRVIKSGTGSKSPLYTDQVKVHYTGMLYTGTKFDSSYKVTSVNGVTLTEEELYLYNKPAQFAVNGLIKGWTEILQVMKEGDRWEVIIPWGLGYGNNGSGTISPFSTLVFDMELMEIVQ